MKAAALLSVLSALATLLLLTSSAIANVAPEPIDMHTHLAHEEVTCDIKGEEAVVTGTFTFSRSRPEGFTVPVFYLPVYAKEGTSPKDMLPEFTLEGKKLDVHFVKKEWENNSNIRGFGKLPEIEGQRVYWFYVPNLPAYPAIGEEDKPRQMTLKIRYTQKLSSNKFIYTPLIPNQKKDFDYGDITLTADRPLTLIDADKHEFAKQDDKLIVEPSDKRAIVVEVAKAEAKLP